MSVVITEKKDHIAVIKLNRPEALNALNTQVLTELNDAITAVEQDSDIYVTIITGEGKAFVAGADIAEMSCLSIEQARKFGRLGQDVFRRIEKMEKPTIAAVNGFALGGGCELALCCDMRVASEKAKFGQPEVGLGITPGFSGTQRLPRLIGKANALQMILTGEMIGATTAYEIGLVNKVIASENLLDEAMELAGKIVANAPLAVRYSALAVKRGLDTDMDTGIDIESELFAMCFGTEDQKNGMKAFLAKEKYEFKGK